MFIQKDRIPRSQHPANSIKLLKGSGSADIDNRKSLAASHCTFHPPAALQEGMSPGFSNNVGLKI